MRKRKTLDLYWELREYISKRKELKEELAELNKRIKSVRELLRKRKVNV